MMALTEKLTDSPTTTRAGQEPVSCKLEEGLMTMLQGLLADWVPLLTPMVKGYVPGALVIVP